MKRFILLLTLTFLHINLQAQLPPDEIAALEDLAEMFPTLNWTGTDHCYWEGIQCDVNGNIIAIVIDGHDSVDGYLPLSFGNFENLKRVSVQNSNLSQLAGTFGALDNLEIANFDGNQFYYMPDSIAGCPNLKELTFSYNRFTTLPYWLGQMRWDGKMTLELLDISSNEIAHLPASMQYFIYVDDVTIYAYDNYLSFADFDNYFIPMGENFFLLPQNNFGDTMTMYKDIGEEVAIWAYIDGWQHEFQWYHNGEPVPNNPTYYYDPLIVEVSEETIGTYTCAATHYLFPSWTLWRNPIYLNLIEPVGINDNARESPIKPYPNPAEDYVFVERPTSSKNEATVTLYDTKGVAVRHEKLNRKTKLDLNGLPKGLYIAEIKSGDGIIVEKILKK